LAQLHQLRGRVGRGAAESHCILLSDVPEAAGRLRAFTETTDGFKIAELDLKERGMGELAGARQHGGIALRYADLERDRPLPAAAGANGLFPGPPGWCRRSSRTNAAVARRLVWAARMRARARRS